MGFKLECGGALSSEDVSDGDIQRAFDDDPERGEFAILTAPDGSFIQASGEGQGPYVLEYQDSSTKLHMQASDNLTKEQVREAFLQYLHGSSSWRTLRKWEPLKKSGCSFSAAALLIAIGSLILVIGISAL